MKSTLTFIISFISLVNLYSQTNLLQEFTNTNNLTEISNYQKVDDGIIISGFYKKDIYENLPVICKINTKGDIVWSTLDSIKLSYQYPKTIVIKSIDSTNTYAIFPTDNYNYKIWKIDNNTGEIIWSTDYYLSSIMGELKLIDYDANSFIVLFTGEQTGVHNSDTSYVSRFNKTSGNEINKTGLYAPRIGIYSGRSIAVDCNKNLYFTSTDTLFKFNAYNFDQLIWKKRLISDQNTDVKYFTKTYIDKYGDLFLFGEDEDGGFITKKMNPNNGEEIWNQLGSGHMYNKGFLDFIDRNNKLYFTLRGGNITHLKTIAIDKNTGIIEWYSAENYDHLGSLTSPYGNYFGSATSLIIDCFKNIYLNGVYGGSINGTWGVMKLDSVGNQIYNKTITLDSSTFDTGSYSKGLFSFNDTLLAIGNIHSQIHVNNAYSTLIEPNTGNIIKRNFIKNNFDNKSKTVDILNDNNTTLILKQQGERVIIEKRLPNNNLAWDYTFPDIDLYAAKMTRENNYIYIFAYKKDTSINNQNLKLYVFDYTNGDIITSNSSSSKTNNITPIDIWTKNKKSFLFFKENDSIYFRTLTLRQYSTTVFGLINTSTTFLDSANPNLDYSTPMNLIQEDLSNLYFAGKDKIHKINHLTNALSTFHIYNTTKNYSSFTAKNSMFILSGNTNNNAIITAIGTNTASIIWETILNTNGSAKKTILDSQNNLYSISSINNSNIKLNKLSSIDGSIIWDTLINSNLNDTITSNDFAINNSEIAINGQYKNKSFISIYNTNGNNIYVDTVLNDSSSFTKTLVIIPTSQNSFLIGGSFIKSNNTQYGFISSINSGCSDFATDTIVTCDSLIWIDGNTYYSNNNTAIYTLTNQAGCDSIVTLNLTLNNNNNTGIDYINTCTPLTWIDGNTYINSNNTASYTLTNQAGCDSIVTLNLTINSIDTTSTYSDSTITLTQSGATYQWLDCDNNSIISGATNQTIAPFINGTYKAVISYNGCVDTSSCITITPCNETEIISVSDASICDTSNSTLSISNTYDNYTWSNGSNLDSIIVTDSSIYSATLGMNNGCITNTNNVKINLFDCALFIDSVNNNVDTCLIDSTTIVMHSYINNITTVNDSVFVTWNFLLNTGDTVFLDAGYTFDQNGVYSIALTINCNGLKASGGEVFYDLIEINHISTFISESVVNDLYKISPNPTKDYISIISEDKDKEVTVEILSINGALIKSQFVNTSSSIIIDLKELENAIYLIRITDSNSKSLIYKVFKNN